MKLSLLVVAVVFAVDLAFESSPVQGKNPVKMAIKFVEQLAKQCQNECARKKCAEFHTYPYCWCNMCDGGVA